MLYFTPLVLNIFMMACFPKLSCSKIVIRARSLIVFFTCLDGLVYSLAYLKSLELIANEVNIVLEQKVGVGFIGIYYPAHLIGLHRYFRREKDRMKIFVRGRSEYTLPPTITHWRSKSIGGQSVSYSKQLMPMVMLMSLIHLLLHPREDIGWIIAMPHHYQ